MADSIQGTGHADHMERRVGLLESKVDSIAEHVIGLRADLGALRESGMQWLNQILNILRLSVLGIFVVVGLILIIAGVSMGANTKLSGFGVEAEVSGK